MAFNLMVVFIVTLVVLANLWACLMVFSCVGFTLVSYPTSTEWNKLFNDHWVRASDIMRWWDFTGLTDLTSPGGSGYARKFHAGRPPRSNPPTPFVFLLMTSGAPFTYLVQSFASHLIAVNVLSLTFSRLLIGLSVELNDGMGFLRRRRQNG